MKSHERERVRERERERENKNIRDTMHVQGANVSKVGTKIKARKQVGKADEATRKKLGEVITSQAADFVKGTEEKKKPPTKEPKDSTATDHLTDHMNSAALHNITSLRRF